MKLTHLKLRSRPVKIRVWKTSVHAAVSYGIEAQGIWHLRGSKFCSSNWPDMEGYKKEGALTLSLISRKSFKILVTRP